MAEERVYRLRRISDGRWRGSRERFEGPDGMWRANPGRVLRRAALYQIISVMNLEERQDIEVIEYEMVETVRKTVGEFLRNG